MSGDNEVAERKKKLAILGVSSVLLVAMVAAVAVGVTKEESAGGGGADGGGSQISASQKNVDTLCHSAEYKETCLKSMQGVNENADMKELIKAAFNATAEELANKIRNSTLYQEVEKDERSKDALNVCKTVFGYAVESLKESIDKVDTFEMSKIGDYAYDLQVWLQAAITHQQTCLDGFENTTSDAGKKMADALKTSLEMSNNALDIVNGLANVLKDFNLDDFDFALEPAAGAAAPAPVEAKTNQSRKLLSEEESEEPSWLSSHQRRLLKRAGGKKRKLKKLKLKLKPNVVVAQDGSGQFTTLNEALKKVPPRNDKPFVIYVKAGIYREYVDILSCMTYVTIVGDGPTRTRFTGSKSFKDGLTTFSTSTFAVNAANFMAINVGFENTAGAESGQAVALRITGDKAVLFRCHVDGMQDSLYANAYRQFYRDVTVWGTIDFVFGDAEAVFQNCTFIVRRPLAGQEVIVAAGGKEKVDGPTALVFQGCRFIPDANFGPPPVRGGETQVYLGRPWKKFAKTVIMDSYIDSVFNPKGYMTFIGNTYHETCIAQEYNNMGPRGDASQRVMWPGVKPKLTPQEASDYYPGKFYHISHGIESDSWITTTGVPYSLGAMPVPTA